jgi:chromosome segregation ATPase
VVEAEHERVWQQLDEASRTNAHLAGTVTALSTDLGDRRREAEHLRSELSRVSAELAELSRNADGLHEHVVAIEADRDRIRAELVSVTADRDAHADALSTTRTELQTIRSSRLWSFTQQLGAAARKVRSIVRH